MNIIVIQAPPQEPVSLAEVYLHLRLTPDDSPPTHPDDDMLRAMIKAAREFCEAVTRRAFVQQTVRMTMPCFPRGRKPYIELFRPPLQVVLSVKYYDEDNALQTVSASDYFATTDFVPRLQFVSQFSAPTIFERNDAVQVDYIVGYDPDDESPNVDYTLNVPLAIKQAIKLIIGDLYENREGSIVGTIHEVNPAVTALLENYRVYTF